MYCPKCKSKISQDAQICETCGFQLNKETKKQKNIETSSGKHLNVSKKNRVTAVLWMILPSVLFVVVIVIYAVVAEIGVGGTFGSGLRTALGLLAVIGILSMIAGIPLAIFFGRRRAEPVSQFDQRSGKGGNSVFPPELKKWNWGAAGLPMIWGVYHSVWWCFINFIPYVNWIWWIIMGMEGNKWAWEKRYWKSIDEFKAAQKKWMPWGVVFFFLPIVLGVLFFAFGLIASLQSLR